jgi:hypothetical protein
LYDSPRNKKSELADQLEGFELLTPDDNEVVDVTSVADNV